MFEQTFKNINDILHKDAGCGSELEFVERTSRVLLLKYQDDLEKDNKAAFRIVEPRPGSSISRFRLYQGEFIDCLSPNHKYYKGTIPLTIF